MRFKTTDAGDKNLKHAAVYWLVDQYIPEGGLAVLYGEPNTGKTFFALDLAWHVAHGKPWFGKDVQPAQVLYVALEGTIKPRLRALRDATGWDGSHFHFAELGSLELEPGSGDLRKLNETLDTLPPPPVDPASGELSHSGTLVVIDPMVQAFVGEENNTAAMTRFITAINSLGDLGYDWPVTKLLVHHSGKDPNKGARGSSVLRGAVDAEVNVRGQRGVRTAVVTKQRDAEKSPPLAFTLASCGSSCRVMPSDSEDGGVASDALSAAVLAELEDSGEDAAASAFYPMATRFLNEGRPWPLRSHRPEQGGRGVEGACRKRTRGRLRRESVPSLSRHPGSRLAAQRAWELNIDSNVRTHNTGYYPIPFYPSPIPLRTVTRLSLYPLPPFGWGDRG